MKTIESNILGTLKQAKGFDDWWESDPVAISFFEDKKTTITYMDVVPDNDPTFIEEADQAIKTFLSKEREDRFDISALAYKNCMDFLRAVEFDEADQPLWDIEHENDIWKFIYPHDIYVTRGHGKDDGIYINVACECEWEQEHGFQMIFKRGNQLVKLSEQDGYIAEEKETLNLHETSNTFDHKIPEEQHTTSIWSKFKRFWT
ncbi:hypothetical protein [Dokdonia sp.]|uniref:DUF6985 domain-containing protein n=1 Tax=Dokdonia sp. TaxID=2024995 RepID=UPI00326781B2